MALGGYKFKGYIYTVPSDFNSSDDSQVKAQCLQMFKCRLRAFMDSCSLSGAQWEFSYTEGSHSFGNYGNVIYDLDNDGYNYGAFFKYRDKDWYMMLMNYQNGDSTSNVFYSYPYSNSQSTIYDLSVNKSSCGLVPFTKDDYRSIISKRLKLRGPCSVGSSGQRTPDIQSTKFGFAIKGCDVIEITKRNSDSYYRFKIMSPDGFSSCCSPNDQTPVFDYICNGVHMYTSSNPTNYVFHINCFPIQSLKDDGEHIYFSRDITNSYYDSNRQSALSIFSQKESYYANPINSIPYAAPLITSFYYGIQESTSSRTIINQDGIRSKGYVKPELLSVNTVFPYSAMNGLNINKPYAGGNYLLVEVFYIADSSNKPTQTASENNGAIYCGWDPSNPDIEQISAWDDYIQES